VRQLRKNIKKSSSRGSITIEACLILPFFLSVFFLLLFLVRFTCTGMVLDHAVNETAKEIAAAAYPISFINEVEDEGLDSIPEGQPAKPGGQGWSLFSDSILNAVISENSKGADISEALGDILEGYRKGILNGIVGKITPAYWDMKSSGKYRIAEALLKEHLDNPLINKQNVRLSIAEFPQGRKEYASRVGVQAYGDFGIDDVVIQVEYDYNITLPFMETMKIKMVHTAVEKAWINGSFGILTAADEGLDLEPRGDTVFITRTGIRYHEGNCRYLRKSRIPIYLSEAEEKGYTPCKVCKPIN